MLLVFQMTVCGLILIPVIDILIKFQTVINFLLLPVACCVTNPKQLKQRVNDYLKLKISQLSEMNDFEIQNFK